MSSELHESQGDTTDDDDSLDSDDFDLIESPPTTTGDSAPSSPILPPAIIEGTSKQGQLEVKDPKKGISIGKSKWRVRWVMVVKGSIHLFKNYEKTEPYYSVNAKDIEIVEYSGVSLEIGHEHTWGIKPTNNASDLRWFAASSQQDVAGWREALLAAKTQEPSPAPVRASIPRSQRTNNPLFRAKKKAATAVGVPVMKKLFGENIRLLETVKHVVSKHIDKETGKKVYNLLIRLVIKINFQFEKKNLTLESLGDVDRPLREALEMLTKYYNTRIRRYKMVVVKNSEFFVKVEQLMAKARDEMCAKLQPYLTPKNIENLRFLCDTLSNAVFLEKVYTDPDLPEELDEIDDIITSYTQFHF